MRNGEVIAGRYELQRELGEGGMATVWLAHDRTLDRPIAIKFLELLDARDRDVMTEQFLREARIAAAVRHRNVIQILDFGTQKGVPFMAMEALSGESMADRMDHGPAFELREVVELAAHCLEGLAAVHEAGIVHRDLKPENIFLVHEPTGVYPKLLDFGISKSVDKRSGRHSAVPTEDGGLIGTPEYMSPEQARGLTDVDRSTDLYSMGVVMYEAISGRLPFDSPYVGDVLMQVMTGGAPDVITLVPEVGQPISDVIAKAMQRDRELRHVSAIAMRGALLAAAQPLLSSPSDPLSLPPRGSRGAPTRAIEPAGASGRSAQTVPSARPPVGGGWRLPMPAAIGALALLAALVAAGVVALGAFRVPTTAVSEPRYIVVQGTPASAAAQPPPATPRSEPATPTPAPPAAAAAVTASAAPAAQPPREPAQSPREPAQRLRPAAKSAGAATPGGQELTRAFDRQKGPVVECLNRHPDAVAERVQMAVRLALDTSGDARTVEVLPGDIAATELGACIARAVRSMRFGPQPEPISIRVPLTARRN